MRFYGFLEPAKIEFEEAINIIVTAGASCITEMCDCKTWPLISGWPRIRPEISNKHK